MIVHIISGLSCGGAEHTLYRLLTAQLGLSDVHVVSLTDEGYFGAKIRAAGIGLTCLRMRGPASLPVASIGLQKLLRRLNPYVVQTWMYRADLIGGLAARLAGIPVCWGIRNGDLSADNTKQSTRVLARTCALLSYMVPSRIISCSSRAASVHRALGYANRFVVIPNGVDLDILQPNPANRAPARYALGISKNAYLVGHVARADPQKDHKNLIEAFKSIASREPRAHLVLAGAGLSLEDSYLQQLLKGHGLERRVTGLGSREDIPSLLNAMDVFVLSSAGEAFPNVVVEAMAAGVPCVVTDVGDAAAIVGNTGWVVPPRNSAALASAIWDALHEAPQEHARRAGLARRRVGENYGIARMASAYSQVWDSVSRGRAQPSAG